METKKITKNTLLKCGDKTYQPIEVDGVIYWETTDFNANEPAFYIYTKSDKTKEINFGEDGAVRGETKVIAQSQPKLKGIPVISLDRYVERLAHQKMINYLTDGNPNEDFKRSTIGADDNKNWWINGYKSNPNQYTQKDIDKAYQLAVDMCSKYHKQDTGIYFDRVEYIKYKTLEQINQIKLIEVDEQFNIISYE